ncbi:MAG TPA: hypothetical protein VHK63_00935 [Candidatus Limnocylindria bacterium]|nr:hypothetical protein [Candidatus Limnocylindria bacterium]
MAELTLLLLLLAAAAVAVAWPLLDRAPDPLPAPSASDEDRQLRHQLALEALRDLEADHRAGSLDDEAYRRQRAQAEARAAATLHGAAAAPSAADPSPEPPLAPARRGSLRLAAAVGGIVLGLVLVGYALPQPIGLAERTVTDQGLAEALAAEDARRAEIVRLQQRVAADPGDAEALSDLADTYLAGSSLEDRSRAAAALILLINLEPANASAYRRLITAYVEVGDWQNARAALASYAEFAPRDEPDIPFFRGLIALRADGDEAEAVRQFDRFLRLAPHDPRAGMVLSLREQADASTE